MTHITSRKRLYEEVWSDPVTKVAKTYGITEAALRKICKKHDIPVPKRGYWRKVEVGKRPAQYTLPNAREDEKVVIYGAKSSASPNVRKRRRKQADQPKPLTVPDTLRKPHRFARTVLSALRRSVTDEFGVVKFGWEGRYYPDKFYVRVAPESVDRSVRILDALLKEFERRSFEIVTSGQSVEVIINKEPLTFSISERVKRFPHTPTEDELARKGSWAYFRPPKYDYAPVGELSIKIEGISGSFLKSAWSDTKTERLEDCLGNFVEGLTFAAEWQAEERERKVEEARKWQLETERHAALLRQRQEEIERVEALSKQAEAWSKATQIRDYVNAVESQGLPGNGEFKTKEELSQWIRWARKQADRLDPLSESPASIVDLSEAEWAEHARQQRFRSRDDD